MDISKQMLDAVAKAKQRAASAEQKFDHASKVIDIKTKSTIELNSEHGVSKVADIAASMRTACDELYATYQSLVLDLDRTCRPLLKMNPSTRAVKEVTEMIKWLNKESEIGSDLSGSLNGFSGNLVSTRYLPGMEC